MEKETNEFPEESIQKETKPNNKRKVVFWSLLASGVGVIIIVALLLIFLLPKEEKYEIELSSNVSVEGEVLSGDGSYKKGDSVTIVAEEITGYRFTGWNFNGKIISTDKEYTFVIGEDTEGEYTANYDKLYSISVEDAQNLVTITGNKTEAVESESIEFTITPNSDYRIIEVKVNNNTLTESDGKYTFNMPAEDVTIIVTYAEEYSITIDSNSSEYVQIEKQNAIAGENVEFTVNEKAGYRVVEVKYNETTLQSDSNTYSFNMPAEDVTISVTYAIEYAITVDSNSSGMVTGVNVSTAINGEQIIVSANDLVTDEMVTLISGLYYIESGSENRVTINQTDGQYSFTMPANNVTIYAESQTYRRLDDFTFSGNSITDYTGSASQLTLPAYYDMVTINSQDYTVEKDTGTQITSIGGDAFQGCPNLTSITIPASVTSIGSGAFSSCTSLQTMKFADGSQLQSIGDYAFRNCTRLSSITIPASVTSIGRAAFSGCSSLAIVYNNSSLNITAGSSGNGDVGYYACEVVNPGESVQGRIEERNGVYYYINDETGEFVAASPVQDRGTLTSITLNLSTTAIKNGAFENCTSLSSITIPSEATIIGDYAFQNCTNLQTVDFGDNSQLQTIGNQAFQGCPNLTSITIPEGVTEIGDFAFNNCYSLALVINNSSNITITKGDYGNGRVGYYAYEVVKAGEAQGSIEKINNVNYYINGTTKVALSAIDMSVSSISLEEDTTSINQYAFSECRNLISINIPSGVTIIGDYAFLGCTSLSSITIPSGVTIIGNSAFGSCTNLQTVDFGDNSQLQTIGNDAFFSCTNLTSITIPSSVTSIGGSAFNGCFSLALVINNSTHLTVTKGNSDNGYVGCYAYEVVNAGEEAKGRIEEKNNVSYYINGTTKIALSMIDRTASSVTLEEGTTAINRYAFDGCTNLTSITIPSSVTSIGNDAFSDCDNLQIVDFGVNSKLQIIGDSAFQNCTNLTSITIPESVTSIGYYAFSGCSNLTSITIPANVTSIGESAFDNCTNLQTVDFGENSQLQTIGFSAFYNCTNLTSITIPENVTSIGSQTFVYCSNLTSVTIESDDIYNVAVGTDIWSHAGGLLANATTVKVLKSIDDKSNTYLSTDGGFTLDNTSDPDYNIYTKQQIG